MKIGLYLGYKLHLHTCFEYASSECSDTQARISLDCSSKISCAVLVFVICLRLPSKQVKSGHYWPTSKTPSERHFAGGPRLDTGWAYHLPRSTLYRLFIVLLSIEWQTVLTQIRLSILCLQKIFLKCSSRRQNRHVLL